jgi:hypothetical protein
MTWLPGPLTESNRASTGKPCLAKESTQQRWKSRWWLYLMHKASRVHTYFEMHVNHADNDHRCISTMSSLQLYTKP